MKGKLANSITLFSVFLLMAVGSYGQTLLLQDSTQIAYPVAASIDRLHNIFIADKNGNLKRYAAGELQQTFSPAMQAEITLVEAWNPLKIFLFYEDFQEYQFLDRFLTGSEKYRTSSLSGFASLMTISSDNNLWVVDGVDFGLKKYNTNFREYTVVTPFDLLLDKHDYEITFIREYHNLVFISDRRNGILVFDNLGNYLRKIPASGISHFTFDEDNLIYISGERLVSINIYNHKRSVIQLPEEALFAFRYGNYVALITNTCLKIFRLGNGD